MTNKIQLLEQFDAAPDNAFVSIETVQVLYQIAKSTVWKWVAEARIVSPIKLSAQCTRWRVGDLRATLAKNGCES